MIRSTLSLRRWLWLVPVIGLELSLTLMAQTGPPLLVQPWSTNQVQLLWPPGTNFNVLEQILALDATNFWQEVPEAPTILGDRYSITRESTNGSSFYRLASHGTPGVSTPPDPATTAPALLPNTFNDLGSSTAFLYTGSNAVQIGMASDTIAPTRAAVVRGKVTKRDKSPLPGVRVALLNHPEYGYTFTRQDGMFDLAVNGGLYTVDFQAIGYCPAQRQVEAPFQDFRTVPDLVLVPLDPVATRVSFSSNAPPQMAAGSPQTDDDGTRTTRVFLPAGTTASVFMPDGSAQPVSGLTLRMTEYSVGTNGQAAMPAALPPTSAYTFCAEFSADEAMNVGAKSIQFNQPVWGYVENFLNVPVGMLVPNGYYDRDRSVWVPSENGLVLRILGVTNGLAQLDLTGSDLVADDTMLAAASFTTAELQQLASTYSSGQSVWRVPLSHFSPWDWNFAGLFKPVQSPNAPGDQPNSNPRDKSPNNYGAVNFTSQVFEESIPLVGVPMTLNYSSARVPDYRVEARTVIPALYWPIPATILGLKIQYEVAGQYTDQELGRVLNATVSWDGYDAYERYVGGTRRANGRVIVEFNPSFFGYSGWSVEGLASLIFQPLFSSFGQTTFAAGYGGGRRTGIGASFTRLLTIPDHRTIGLGGWSLTPHHSYDPVGHFLYLGDGRVLKQDRFANGMGLVPGLSALPQFLYPLRVAAGPDGTLFFQAFFADSYSPRLFKLGSDGQFAFISGNDYDPGVVSVYNNGYATVDGKSALLAAIGPLGDMTVGPDGSLYFREQYGAIGRIDPQGILHLVLGDGPRVYPPDGSSARGAFTQETDGVGHLAVSRDGAVYYDDAWNLEGTNRYFIRKVAPDGRIYTIAGQAGVLPGTSEWHSQVGLKASEAQLWQIRSLAVASDGTLYVSPLTRTQYGVGGIYKITADGTLDMVMNSVPFPNVGWEPYGITGDEGSNAVTFVSRSGTALGPTSLQVAPDGSLAFHQRYGDAGGATSLWRITSDGTLQRLAGRGPYSSVSTPASRSQQGANPLQVVLHAGIWQNFAIGPDNSLTLVENRNGGSAYRIGASASGFTAQELQIPSEDASEVYVFDARGSHLRTLNGLTGSTNWSFSYNADNLVTDVSDANGLVTHIERDGAGQPTAIVGPYGQRTALTLDANGFLSAVVNPASEATVLTQTRGGLLTSITGPRNHTYTVAYDTNGLATQVRDPLGGGYDMTRTDLGTQLYLASSTTLSNVESRTLSLLPSGDTFMKASHPDGTWENTTLWSRKNWDSVVSSDGTVGSYASGGDPRFPTQTRLPTMTSIKLPGVPQVGLGSSRTVALADLNNPFSVSGLTNMTSFTGQPWAWTDVYDGTNRLWRTTSPEGRQSVAGLDARSRLIHQRTAGQTPMDIFYDAQGRIRQIDDTASVGLRRTMFSYDALGRLSKLIDPLNRTNSYSYDGAGRLQQLTLADGQVANFQSDAEFHLTSVTPPGRSAHRFEYNAVGLVTNYVPPVVNGLDESVHYAYDADRELTRVELPDGQNVLFARGPGRRIDQLVLGSGPTLTYAYGPNNGLPTNIVSTTGDSLRFDYAVSTITNVSWFISVTGNVSVVSNYSGLENAQGSLVTNATWSGTVTGSVGVIYNAHFRPASQSVNGAAISYSYDRDLLLTQAGNLTVTNDPTTGFITGTKLGNVTDHRQFDDRGLLTNYVARVSGASLWALALSYDLIGRLTNKVEILGGTTRTFGYGYDVAGRLERVWQDGALAVTYSYDVNGNRLTRNAESATYDAQDRVQSYAGSTFAWSRNGNLHTRMSGGQTTTYTYDVRGALTRAAPDGGQPIDYVNDAAGRRIGKKVAGTLQRGWLWDEDQPVAELNGNSTVALRFVYASDDATPSYLIKGANTYRLFSDERGSVRLVVNIADASVAQQMDYDEFGRVLHDTNPGFQPFGYAGGLYDPDTGLVRFGARDYSAETGQWTARDPLDFDGGQLSLYAYAGNDPVNTVDPLGLGPFSAPTPRPPMVARHGEVVGKIIQIVSAKKGGTGSILVRRKGSSEWRRGHLDQPLYLGDEVKTDANTLTAVLFEIGGRVGINKDTQVRLNSERSVEDSHFRLKRVILRKGGLWRKAESLATPLEITTTGGLMGIKG